MSNDAQTSARTFVKGTSALVPPASFDAPTGAISQTFPRAATPGANISPLTSAQLFLSLIWLPPGTINSITYVSATTAATLPLNQWFGLFDTSYNKLALTADDTVTAWAANTAKTLTISGGYKVTSSGLYYVGIMVKATTVPTLTGNNGTITTAMGLAPITGGTSTGSLTNPASCPSTVAAPTVTVNRVYAYVS